MVLALASACTGSQWERSALVHLRGGANAADVEAALGQPENKGRGSKPFWTYRWRAPQASDTCQLLVVFDADSGLVSGYQVDLLRPHRGIVVDAWPGRAADPELAWQCLCGAPPS